MPYAARIVEIERTRVRADCAVDRAKAKDSGVLHEEGALLRKERLRCGEVEHCRIDLHLPEVGIERHSPAGARCMEQNVSAGRVRGPCSVGCCLASAIGNSGRDTNCDVWRRLQAQEA